MRTLLLTAALFFTGVSWLTACGPGPEPTHLMHKQVGQEDCLDAGVPQHGEGCL